ncbi:hypothetical protein CspeluHIS016_0202200 [Cutaneotrichosporon spelunceum]|uniref:Uncharacterized protein n=1 Tax=Cutaneotrichosporon spelunceum TaxID=1672016 RepID=A0AAD3YAX1_9TREE|nr:hypothetical protein CspeluHIS016_0202200 [Cutaneotrichosporon spelunceum]
MRDDASTTEEPRTPVSATSSVAVGGRRVPLPAVKGTMGGIESPRRELFSPASTLRASTSPAPSTHRDSTTTSATVSARPNPTEESNPAALIFRADPRMTTAFEGMPEGADAIKAKFGV